MLGGDYPPSPTVTVTVDTSPPRVVVSVPDRGPREPVVCECVTIDRWDTVLPRDLVEAADGWPVGAAAGLGVAAAGWAVWRLAAKVALWLRRQYRRLRKRRESAL